jgi:hypothetical protein
MLKKIRQVLAIILVLFCSLLFVWGTLPLGHKVDVQSIQPTSMRLQMAGHNKGLALLETRLVNLERPSTMRIGDSEKIILLFTYLPDEVGAITWEKDFSDAYTSNNVMVEARFEVAGVRATPANPIRESMPTRQEIRFEWEVNADEQGISTGLIWLSLRFLPLDGGTPVQVPIYVREVQIRTMSLFAISGPVARLSGGVGIILGLSLIFSDMIAMVKHWNTKKITPSVLNTKGN